MNNENLKNQIKDALRGRYLGVFSTDAYIYEGYRKAQTLDKKRAYGFYALFTLPIPNIYADDYICGCLRTFFFDADVKTVNTAKEEIARLGFYEKESEFIPDQKELIEFGVKKLIEKEKDANKKIYLNGLYCCIERHRREAIRLYKIYNTENFKAIEKNCFNLLNGAPENFEEGLQLLWLNFIYSEYVFGAKDNFKDILKILYPLCKKNFDKGLLTKEYATELLKNAFIKLYEYKVLKSEDKTYTLNLTDDKDFNGVIVKAVKDSVPDGLSQMIQVK